MEVTAQKITQEVILRIRMVAKIHRKIQQKILQTILGMTIRNKRV